MPQSESPLEAFWRSVIMLGTLIVIGLALYVYGPPPEQAAEMASRVVARVREAVAAESSPSLPIDRPPAPTLSRAAAPLGALSPAHSASAPLAPPGSLTPVAPRHFPSPASTASSVAPAPLPPPSPLAPADASVASLAGELARLGARDLQVTAWGADGALHRCCFSAPLGDGSPFRRHFEAVESSPSGAVSTALAEFREWRIASLQPINR